MTNPTDEDLRKKLFAMRNKSVEKTNLPLAIEKITNIIRTCGPVRAKEVRLLMEEIGFSPSLSRTAIAKMWDTGLINVSNEQYLLLVEDKKE